MKNASNASVIVSMKIDKEGAVPPPQIEKINNLTADHELFPKKKNTTD